MKIARFMCVGGCKNRIEKNSFRYERGTIVCGAPLNEKSVGISCSCLDHKYEDATSEPKKGA